MDAYQKTLKEKLLKRLDNAMKGEGISSFTRKAFIEDRVKPIIKDKMEGNENFIVDIFNNRDIDLLQGFIDLNFKPLITTMNPTPYTTREERLTRTYVKK